MVPEWDDLHDEQRRTEARKMELYAAMVSIFDFDIGRLVAYLEQTGELDDTIVIFSPTASSWCRCRRNAISQNRRVTDIGRWIRQQFEQINAPPRTVAVARILPL